MDFVQVKPTFVALAKWMNAWIKSKMWFTQCNLGTKLELVSQINNNDRHLRGNTREIARYPDAPSDFKEIVALLSSQDLACQTENNERRGCIVFAHHQHAGWIQSFLFCYHSGYRQSVLSYQGPWRDPLVGCNKLKLNCFVVSLDWFLVGWFIRIQWGDKTRFVRWIVTVKSSFGSDGYFQSKWHGNEGIEIAGTSVTNKTTLLEGRRRRRFHLLHKPN